MKMDCFSIEVAEKIYYPPKPTTPEDEALHFPSQSNNGRHFVQTFWIRNYQYPLSEASTNARTVLKYAVFQKCREVAIFTSCSQEEKMLLE